MTQVPPVTITMAPPMQVLVPRSGPMYPVPCNEWDFMKKNIGRLADQPWLLQTIGSVFVGAGIAELGTIFSGAIPENSPQWIARAWSFGVGALICGAVTLFAARQNLSATGTTAQNVVEYMTLIEGRYSRE